MSEESGGSRHVSGWISGQWQFFSNVLFGTK